MSVTSDLELIDNTKTLADIYENESLEVNELKKKIDNYNIRFQYIRDKLTTFRHQHENLSEEQEDVNIVEVVTNKPKTSKPPSKTSSKTSSKPPPKTSKKDLPIVVEDVKEVDVVEDKEELVEIEEEAPQNNIITKKKSASKVKEDSPSEPKKKPAKKKKGE